MVPVEPQTNLVITTTMEHSQLRYGMGLAASMVKTGPLQGCLRSCFQNALIDSCQCGDPRVPMPPGTNHPRCKVENSMCIRRHTGFARMQAANALSIVGSFQKPVWTTTDPVNLTYWKVLVAFVITRAKNRSTMLS